MKLALASFACLALASPLSAQEAKPDYADLSKLVRGMVLRAAPKEVNAAPAWGLSTPFPAKLRFPGLARTTIQNGSNVELAHGSWKKAKVWMNDPEKDFALAITDLRPLDATTYRVSMTAVAPLLIDYEFQQWLNGLFVVGVNGRAASKVKVDLDCDVTLSLGTSLDVTVEPKVAATKVDVLELDVLNNGGGGKLNNELRGFVQAMAKNAEPQIRAEANKAIAAALKDGKGTFSAAKLYEAIKK